MGFVAFFRYALLGSALFALGYVSPVHAQESLDVTSASDAVAENAGLSSMDLLDIIGLLINIILSLLGVVFLFITLYAGWLWMTAQGDPKQIEKARNLLINGVVGLIIMLSAYAITRFVINLLQGAGLSSSDDDSNAVHATVAVERLSGALGSGAIKDHYPDRNATNVPRNARIMVTFKNAMNIENFIEGYSVNGTPLDTSDDTVATAINSENVKIYRTADGVEAALADVSVSFSEDLSTFVFDPTEYLGSPSESMSYTVLLTEDIKNAEGDEVFTGENADGYEWSFETGTTIDTEPPHIISVVPAQGGVYARNITVQVTFDEAIDPTTASGTRSRSGGYDIIQTAGIDAVPLAGTYTIANSYTTVTFTTEDACGTNSCGETIYCLPGDALVSVYINAATPGVYPPQVDVFPYDGIVDVSGNTLDGNADGTAGDDYAWWFSTTESINLDGPVIKSISPNILENDVVLDVPISVLFADVLLASYATNEEIAITNKEIVSAASHELWYKPSVAFLDTNGEEIVRGNGTPEQTLVTIKHGTFLESVDGKTYMYGVTLDDQIKNQYQNCFAPAEGPTKDGGTCSGPYCCNGDASATACVLF